MKPKVTGSRGTGVGRKPDVRIPRIPIEWMDPMSWRLPSGKDLAEFALQAGFLAPLMLGTPRLKRRPAGPVAASGSVGTQTREEPEPSGTFRESDGLFKQ
jgi:hypothetical protein